MNIFTVVTITKTGESRTWGWFPDFKMAEEAILGNWGDIFECGTFQWALVEEVTEGIMPTDSKETWYLITYEGDNKYQVEKCNKPEKFHNIVSFSMG